MRVLIVDDEPPARARLRALVTELGAGVVAGEAANGRDALALAEAADVEVVLLDIRMPVMDGLETARHLAAMPTPPAVIFTTAYGDHALAAFDSNAVAYLLKPIRRERLAEALERARVPTRAQLGAIEEADPSVPAARTHLSATRHGSLVLVPVEEIRFLRAEHKYVVARHPGGELLVEEPLSALEEAFGARFVRVHRNALVALAHVRSLGRAADGGLVVRMDGVEEPVAVSRRLAQSVRSRLRC